MQTDQIPGSGSGSRGPTRVQAPTRARAPDRGDEERDGDGDGYTTFDRRNRDRDREQDQDQDQDESDEEEAPTHARVRVAVLPPSPPQGVDACTLACASAPLALSILQEVAVTLPSLAPTSSCSQVCSLLGANELALSAALPAMPLCTQVDGAGFTAGFTLDPAVLGEQALASVSAGLGGGAAAAIRAATGGSMTPAQALAADALVGTLRSRQEGGWARVGEGQPCLSFPKDHGLHRNMADEWYFVVGVLTARGEGETADTTISFCWMLDWRLLAPTGPADPLSNYIVDAQFAVAEEGAPNVAMHAALWGGATALKAANHPLVLEAGGMSLREVPGPAAEGLNALQLKAVNAASGTMLALTVARNPAVSPLVLELGTGIVGDLPNGNGNLYYSAPFLAVQPGGAIVSCDAAGKRTARTVTGGLAWFDHQLGTLGQPATWGTAATWKLIAAVAPATLPIIDRGFGVGGQENWWGFMFSSGPLAGVAFMGTVLSLQPAALLKDAAVSGNWILPDGRGGAAVHAVSGTVSTTATVASADGSPFASGFSFSLPHVAPQGGPVTVTATNLAADGFMSWSKGDIFSEAAVVLTASDGSRGYGWAEQVGWDTQGTQKLLGTLGVTGASLGWERAPASFAAGGYWFLVGAALLGLLLLLLAGVGVAKAVTHHRRRAWTKPVFAPMPAPYTPTEPVPVQPMQPPPAILLGGQKPLEFLLGGMSGPKSKPAPTAVDSLVARWLQ